MNTEEQLVEVRGDVDPGVIKKAIERSVRKKALLVR